MPRQTRLGLEHLETRFTPSIDTLAAFYDNGAESNYSAGMVMDGGGNLYLAPEFGGAAERGAVYELKKGSGQVTTLFTFTGPDTTGEFPVGGVVVDAVGNLYGITSPGSPDPAVIYEITAGTNTFTELATASDNFVSGLTLDGSGNLYFTAEPKIGPVDEVDVCELARGSGTVTTLATLSDPGNFFGIHPVTPDAAGNLYGVTQGFGDPGTVFEVVRGSGTVTTLATFNSDNGTLPSRLAVDGAGNLYGTMQSGGAYGFGTVFELAHGSGTVTTLAAFHGDNGAYPEYGVFVDGDGNLYGATQGGGDANSGTVFQVALGSGTITTLVSSKANAGQFLSSVIRDNSGNLYGDTPSGLGAYGPLGTIFEVPHLTTAQLVQTQQPPPAPDVGTPFTYAVTADDSSGRPLAGYTGPMTVTLTDNATGATLGGTTTVNAVAGVATFNDLTIDRAGTGYTLTATAGGLAGAVSNAFNVRLPSFVLLRDGFLYERNSQTGVMLPLRTNVTAVGGIGTSPTGAAMVDVITGDGFTYEYQDGLHWTTLARGVSKAEAGTGVSVVLIGSTLYEYHDATASWTCLADRAATFSVGTDTAGATLIGVILTDGFAYEYSDRAGWRCLASAAAQVSVGQGGYLDLVLAGENLYQHSDATNSWTFLYTHVSAVALGTDAFGAPLSAVAFDTAGNPAYLASTSTGLSAALAVGATLSKPTDGYTLFIVAGNCNSLDPTRQWAYWFSDVVAAV